MTTQAPLTVPAGLRRLVSEIALLTGGDDRPLVHMPDAGTALIFRMTTSRGDLLVAGPRTRASYYVGKDFPLCVRLRLRPSAARLLLGVPVSELVDRVVGLGQFWRGAGRLAEELAGCGGDVGLIVGRLEKELPARAVALSSADVARGRLVRAAAEALTGGEGRESVAALARRLAVSERGLREMFRDGVGLSPKRFERIQRIRRVLARGHTSRPARLAAASGYYDQSHMGADFRALMGVSPAAFFAGHLPPLLRC